MFDFLEWLADKGIILEVHMKCSKCGNAYDVDDNAQAYGNAPARIKCRKCGGEMIKA